ncbi:hypothetical protein ACFZDI_10460 [Streptomyces sp. NPDC007907]
MHLLLGEQGMPGQVLGAGIDILEGRYAVARGPQLPDGGLGHGSVAVP